MPRASALLIDMDQEIEPELARNLIAERDHLLEFPGRIDMQQRKGRPPGWKAFRARCSRTDESLPME